VINGQAIEKIEELVQSIQKPTVPQAVGATAGAPVIVVPSGWEPRKLDVPVKPTRIAQRIALHDAASFIEYVKDFRQETTTILLDEDKKAFTAVLDYHGGGAGKVANVKPEWCDHIATFVARTTPEWDTWFDRSNKGFGQVEFATFIEDNQLDVVEPAGADLLEITKTLEAKQDVAYSSAVRLDNGAFRFHFDEVIKPMPPDEAMRVFLQRFDELTR